MARLPFPRRRIVKASFQFHLRDFLADRSFPFKHPLFSDGFSRTGQAGLAERRVAKLERKLGQQALKIDFFEGCLERTACPLAKLTTPAM